MYTSRNFKTKSELVAAVIAANSGKGPKVTYFQPGPFGGSENRNGKVYIEGPHAPQPHKWYAICEAVDGAIVKVK